MRRRKWWFFLAFVVLIVVAVVVAGREPTIASGSYVVVPLKGSYDEGGTLGLFDRLLGAASLTLADLLLELDKAAVDSRIKGVILRVEPLALSLAQVQEIRATLQALQARDKEVIAWVVGEAVVATIAHMGGRRRQERQSRVLSGERRRPGLLL